MTDETELKRGNSVAALYWSGKGVSERLKLGVIRTKGNWLKRCIYDWAGICFESHTKTMNLGLISGLNGSEADPSSSTPSG
ncbi:hypothetical protein CDD81_6485 [Ophiocordyceps australis]|uniref:Uncharacterized protein n=1 Tax=Ophiocordyceps australis TaxID=1399860 RepID=A0A2C5XLV7_9HYPO|nr:hypothetical protein CDD81_6485 [Ophiocordyceps australis]